MELAELHTLRRTVRELRRADVSCMAGFSRCLAEPVGFELAAQVRRKD